MRDTKRRFEMVSLFDHTHMEKHLTDMAARGWLVEKIGHTGWVYRRIEPADLTFAVTYFPDASDFDPAPTEEQETFRDFCAHTGWEFAASSAQMQIFYNRRPDPVPIETDPDLQIDNIHRSMKKTMLIADPVLFLVLLMNLWNSWTRFRDDPVWFLSSSTQLLCTGAFLILLVLMAGELGAYFLWRRRAKRAAEQGLFRPTPNTSLLQRICLTLAVLLLLGTVVLQTGNSGNQRLLLLAMGCTALMFAVILGGKVLMKRLGVSRKTNLIVTICLCLFVPLVFACAPYFVIYRAPEVLDRQESPVSAEAAPLTVEMLLDMDPAELEVTFCYHDSSPLLSRTRFRQEQTYGLEQNWLYYSLAEIRVPALYDRCRQSMLEEMCNQSLYERFGEETPYSAVAIAPEPWGAEAAWQLHYRDDSGLVTVSDTWLLCYPDRIVTLTLSWTPTPEQMAVIGTVFAGK
ncbi:MAG: DUF2812 domain-containing protein [Oscillospiraceae bacterium]|nr:DUF2812 domain-containing protein [Oscillospiraceae bacterium]